MIDYLYKTAQNAYVEETKIGFLKKVIKFPPKITWNSLVHLKVRLKNMGTPVNIPLTSYLSYSSDIQVCKGGGEIVIGPNTHIRDHSRILTHGGRIEIGKRCKINAYAILYGHGDLEIGDHVSIAAHSVVIPANHIYENKDELIDHQGEQREGITIEDDVWIGANCTILDGVTIGEGAVVGAGSVVTKSIPPYTVVAGVPAKEIDKRR